MWLLLEPPRVLRPCEAEPRLPERLCERELPARDLEALPFDEVLRELRLLERDLPLPWLLRSCDLLLPCELLLFPERLLFPEPLPFREERPLLLLLRLPPPIPITSFAAVITGLRVEIALPATAPTTPPTTEPTAAPAAVPLVVGIGGTSTLPIAGTLISELECCPLDLSLSSSGIEILSLVLS
ncbi:MAG: hypothetical protein JO354_02025 [Verrucomicrobia bacterium]|nr:hypothetical protein [Verrucomicrobiota bacterium]